MLIDCPLLVVGRGPAALVVAKVAAGCGLACVLVGHEAVGGERAVPLDDDAVAALKRHGLLDVLRPYFEGVDPPTIAPGTFEDVIKHHCVADLNVTVYDQMTVIDQVAAQGGVRGVLSDGASRWEITADAFVDAAPFPTELSAAILAGAAAALATVAAA